jgi:hypothetical protein
MTLATSKQWDRLKSEWNATLTIADLADEIEESHGEVTPESVAIRELERGFPLAVQSLVSLAIHAEDPRVRNKAANDVINHNLALMQARVAGDARTDPLLNFIKSVTEEMGKDAKQQVQGTARKKEGASEIAHRPPVGPSMGMGEIDPTEWLRED